MRLKNVDPTEFSEMYNKSRGSISKFSTRFWMIFVRTALPNMPMKPEHLLRNGKR